MQRVVVSMVVLAMLAGVSFTLVSCGKPEPAVEYFCAMHPQIVQDQPGNCPICQMKLEKRTPQAAGPAAPHSEHASGVPGRTTVVLSPEKRRMLGVRTEPVRRTTIDGTFRTVGRVAVDERRVHHIHPKFEGYVERLNVDFTGRFVQKGEALLEIYSPELVATQQEYLLALRAQTRTKDAATAGVAEDGAALAASARRRLQLWDISAADIARLEQTGEVRRRLNLYAPMNGYVLEKTVLHGMRVTPMDSLFLIADLEAVWVLADIYEQDLPRVTLGAKAEIRASHVPGREWSGRVAFIAPVLDEATRTIKVRIEVPNQDAALKPEMFADVVLHYGGESALAVPESAVLDTGRRQIVFVDRPDGTLEPREVTLGAKVGEIFPVRSGVVEGENVVVSANFLVDSESSLKAALPGPAGAPPAPGSATPDPHAGHR
jgi:Cu(I)/Ag(I) efflux system membrane fusion protein